MLPRISRWSRYPTGDQWRPHRHQHDSIPSLPECQRNIQREDDASHYDLRFTTTQKVYISIAQAASSIHSWSSHTRNPSCSFNLRDISLKGGLLVKTVQLWIQDSIIGLITRVHSPVMHTAVVTGRWSQLCDTRRHGRVTRSHGYTRQSTGLNSLLAGSDPAQLLMCL